MGNHKAGALNERFTNPPTSKGAVGLAIALGLTVGIGLGLAQEGPKRPDRRRIVLKAGSFDPTAGVLRHSGLPQVAAYAAGVRGGYLIQFDRPIRGQDLAAIQQAGGSVKGYVPMMTLEVVMDEQTLSTVEQLPGVRWGGVNQPSFKVSPELMETAASDPAATVELQVNVYPGETASAAATIGAHGRTNTKTRPRTFIRYS